MNNTILQMKELQFKKIKDLGIAWQSRGWASVLSLQAQAQAQYLFGELQSHKSCGTAKEKNK